MEDNHDIILEMLKVNSVDAIDLIYDNYASNLYGYIYHMIGNEDEAQDILQLSFVKIWKNIHHYDPEKSKIFTWLLTICRNTAIDHLRKRSKTKDRENQMHQNDVYQKEDNFFQEGMDIQLHMSKIENKYRKVIELLFF